MVGGMRNGGGTQMCLHLTYGMYYIISLSHSEDASGCVLDWTGVTVWKQSSMPFDFDSGYDEIWR